MGEFCRYPEFLALEAQLLRLWSLHPKFLDTKGLTAVWREGLLAQRVLSNESKGYRNHPQLIRFKEHPQPATAIGYYLFHIWKEAEERGYNFKKEKILKIHSIKKIKVTDGQLEYEFKLLRNKLRRRDMRKYNELVVIKQNTIECHPVFSRIKGDIEKWEKPLLRNLK